MIEQIVRQLTPFKHHLKDSIVGLEKEALRSSISGGIAHSAHPQALGSALTNPYITTDFSEALLEIVTPPLKGVDNALNFLRHIQYFVYQNMPADEILWHQSMPCVIRDGTYIPLAKYGSSNLGKMKTVYRRGLGLRYGRTMQAIAGIHFNYSFSQEFLKAHHATQPRNIPYQNFSDDCYMALTRNVMRYSWLLTYLFGASPSVCQSVMENYHDHTLVAFNDNTLFEPHATSLRVGDIGYQNTQTDELGFKVNYNSLAQYINDLQSATNTPCLAYEKIGLKKNDKYLQLNTNILQIENEYYSNIRPKQIAGATESVSQALRQRGIQYIELRSLDINPLTPLGIDEQQMRFVELFIMYCLLEESPPICSIQQVEIDKNNKLIAHQGRQDDLMLSRMNQPISRHQYSTDLLEKMKKVLPLFDARYHRSFDEIAKRVDNTELTPSAQLLNNMTGEKQGFFHYTKHSSFSAKESILSEQIDAEILTEIAQTAKESLSKQTKIEQSDTLSFEAFLTSYFDQ